MSITEAFLVLTKATHNDLRKIQQPRVKLRSTDSTHTSIDMSWYDEWLSQ
ncbi:hypothetical protein N7471_005695 [Penicillium samsonianum]|nr:uncharacterized protein N7471_005695 [Penicillium samsonianum]KAJ6139209.1 hypothetical protein N7471_005695 [Penicillium samsonianum]